MNIKDLELGASGIITKVGGDGGLRQHFLDMGLVPGAKVTLVKYAPMGDPIEIRIYDYELTIRLKDAEKIKIEEIKPHLRDSEESDMLPGDDESAHRRSHKGKSEPIEHPGLGESGRFHKKDEEDPWPEEKILKFALAGNQNSGKTTLFNRLTGSNQRVGNFPGVTVDKKDGVIQGRPKTSITDLPGIYSLSPYSKEEILTREFILYEKPEGLINIVDATNIERSLYLTMQLMELEIPMVLALNMMDELSSNGGSVRINEMEKELGIPVVPISAAKSEGIEELVEHAVHVAHYREKPKRADFCLPDREGGALHRCLHAIMHLIEDRAESAGIPVRFAATKLIEGDIPLQEELGLSESEKETIEKIIGQMEAQRGLDRAAAVADMRFSFINKLVKRTVIKPKQSREYDRSRKIDHILTGKYTAIPIFIMIMSLVFYLTFNVIGKALQDLLSAGIESLASIVGGAMASAGISKAIRALVIDGIFNGVGAVLSFLPVIVTLFFFLSLLEDTGYMARVAFVMDRLLRKIGLSGRSVVPMIMGFGCTVAAVMATRTLPSERDRRMTIMLTPFMSCSAKMPIYVMLTKAFFPNYAWLVMIALYIGGIAIAILVALISKNSIFRGEPVPFVLELPNYRMPSPKNVGRLLWNKAEDFLRRAFTIIFIATIFIWFLENFDMALSMTEDPHNSILAAISGLIAPIFSPFGCSDWRLSSALITGFIAKESLVSTIAVLFGSIENLQMVLNPLSALAFLVFCLLYTPCIATVAAVKRELGLKWSLIMIVFQCIIAWIFAFFVYMVGSAFLILF
jgi:ferrous iron transport protein B